MPTLRETLVSFRKPITTLGGLIWWTNILQDTYFIMQKHNVGLPLWPYQYRILLRENRMEIANSNDLEEIQIDWEYLQTHAVPQIEQKIDLGLDLGQLDIMGILSVILKII
jgi:hypothetical protein